MLDRKGEGFLAVSGGSDHFDPVEETEEGAETLAHHPLVIGDQDTDRVGHAGTHSSTRNPCRVGPALRAPPRSSARSRIPVSP